MSWKSVRSLRVAATLLAGACSLTAMMAAQTVPAFVPAAPPVGEIPGVKPPLPHPLNPYPTPVANTRPYDLLLVNGHVIDTKNHLDRVTDVAIKDGRIAAVGDHLDPQKAAKTIDVSGDYVTPGLIDIHTHDYASTGEIGSYAGDNSIRPDGFTFRSGVTTVGDAGSSGWRNFEDFKEHIIDREQTRVLAFLNIVGAGMRGARFEDNLADMQAVPTAWMAKRYPETVIGIKSAHYAGPEWSPYQQAVEAGTIAHIPVMIDYGVLHLERPLYDLLTRVLRPGDIYTHAYSGERMEQDPLTLGPQAGLLKGRARGIYFDAGTGGNSFRFRVAVPLLRAGFTPDSLSTDLHIGSMNSATKDMLTVMSKFLAMGQTLDQVVAETTWNPAREIQHPELGNLSVGAPADVAVLSEEHGRFGYIDSDDMTLPGNVRLVCQLTVRAGKVVYDLNGISMDPWNNLAATSDPALAHAWTSFIPRRPLRSQLVPQIAPSVRP